MSGNKNSKKGSGGGGGGSNDSSSTKGSKNLFGQGSASDKKDIAVIRSWIDKSTCIVPETVSIEESFVMFVPMGVFKPGAVTFNDFKSDEGEIEDSGIAQAYEIMLTFFFRFVSDLVFAITLKTQPPKGKKAIKKKQPKKKKKKNNNNNVVGDDDEAVEENDTDEEDANEEDNEEDNNIVQNDADFQQTLNRHANDEDSSSDEPPDYQDLVKRLNAVSDAAERLKNKFYFLIEPILYQDRFETANGKEDKDRKVLGYRFWFLNCTREVRGKDVLERTFLYMEDQYKNGKKFVAKPWHKYLILHNKDILPKYHATTAVVQHLQDDIINSKSKPMNDSDNIFNPNNMFSSVWAVIHPSIVKYGCSMQAGKNYISEGGRLFSIKNDVRKFFYRPPDADMTEEKLNNRMFLHIQARKIDNVAKSIPVIVEFINKHKILKSNDIYANPKHNSLITKKKNSSATSTNKKLKTKQTIKKKTTIVDDDDDDDDDEEDEYEDDEDDDDEPKPVEELSEMAELQSVMWQKADPNLVNKRIALYNSIDQGSKNLNNETVALMLNNSKKESVNHRELMMYAKGSLFANIQFESLHPPLLYAFTSPYTSIHIDNKRSWDIISSDLITNKESYKKDLKDYDALPRKLYSLFNKNTIEEYEATCCSTNLSPSGSAIVDYIKNNKIFDNPALSMPKVSSTVTPFQQYELSLAAQAEYVYGINDKHSVFALLIKNCYDAYRMDFNSVHQHTLMQSLRGSDSKSYLQDLLHKHVLIAETSQVITYKSLKSLAIDANLNDSVTMFDEMPAAMIDSKKGDESERMFKQLLSSGLVVAEILMIVNGERFMRRVRCEYISVFICSMNNPVDIMSSAMKRRFAIIHCDEKKEASRSILENSAMNRLNKVAGSDSLVVATDSFHRNMQAMIFHIEKLIYIGAIHPVSTDVCEIMLVYLSNELAIKGFPDPNPSVYERIRVGARVNCILDSIVSTWCIEGSEFYEQPITFNQFSRLDPKLWINVQHAFKSFADHSNMLIDPAENIVKKALVQYRNAHLSSGKMYHEGYKLVSGTREDPVLDPTYLGFYYGSKPGAFEAFISCLETYIKNMKDIVPSPKAIASILDRWCSYKIMAHTYEIEKGSYKDVVMGDAPDYKAIEINVTKYIKETKQGDKHQTYRIKKSIDDDYEEETAVPTKKHCTAVTKVNSCFYIHRDFLYDGQPNASREPRDIIITILKDILSHKFQIPQRLIFDNDVNCPKKVTFIETDGAAPNETRILHISSVTKINENEKRLIPNYAKFESIIKTEETVIVDKDLDSWGMCRHLKRIGFTPTPISKQVYNLTELLTKKHISTNKTTISGGGSSSQQHSFINNNKRFSGIGSSTMTATHLSSINEILNKHGADDSIDEDVNFKYDSTGEGYFMGAQVKDLFLDHNRALSNLSIDSIIELYTKLDNLTSNFNAHFLYEDVDFDPMSWIVKRHPSQNPLFHKYAWDILAEMNHKPPTGTILDEDDEDDNMNDSLTSSFIYCYVPPVIGKTDNIESLILRRTESLMANIPRFKMIHTHPLVFNQFLNAKIKATRELSDAVDIVFEEIYKSRSERWSDDKNVIINVPKDNNTNIYANFMATNDIHMMATHENTLKTMKLKRATSQLLPKTSAPNVLSRSTSSTTSLFSDSDDTTISNNSNSNLASIGSGNISSADESHKSKHHRHNKHHKKHKKTTTTTNSDNDFIDGNKKKRKSPSSSGISDGTMTTTPSPTSDITNINKKIKSIAIKNNNSIMIPLDKTSSNMPIMMSNELKDQHQQQRKAPRADMQLIDDMLNPAFISPQPIHLQKKSFQSNTTTSINNNAMDFSNITKVITVKNSAPQSMEE